MVRGRIGIVGPDGRIICADDFTRCRDVRDRPVLPLHRRSERDRLELGGVDKFVPVSGDGEIDHAEEAAVQLIAVGSDGAVDLKVAEHALDAVGLLVQGRS